MKSIPIYGAKPPVEYITKVKIDALTSANMLRLRQLRPPIFLARLAEGPFHQKLPSRFWLGFMCKSSLVTQSPGGLHPRWPSYPGKANTTLHAPLGANTAKRIASISTSRTTLGSKTTTQSNTSGFERAFERLNNGVGWILA